MTMIIHTEQLSKSFVRGNQEISVLSAMNLAIEQGSFVVPVGPSGCGKSTLLNIVTGLLPATSGKVYYRGNEVIHPSLEVGYLTQKETLMPWRNIESNIGTPLEIRGVGKRMRQHKIQRKKER